jgi:hypothetical protein
MRMSHVRGLGAAAAAVALAACNGAGSPGGSASLPTSTDGLSPAAIERLAAMTMPRYAGTPARPDRAKSWIAPGATKQKRIFYVSDWATDDVFVYAYPGATMLGKLTGFKKPYGQCVDRDGNIWIADFAASSIVEYSHGGKTPIASLATNGAAIGCAVSPTGELAVANFSTAAGPGDIQVFQNESGTPTNYSNSSCYYLWPPGYDKKGNLYVEGKDARGKKAAAYVCELPAGGSSLATVTIDQRIHAPGSAMWDGEYIALTDQNYEGQKSTAIYQAKEAASGDLTVVGTTDLTDTCDKTYADIPQPFIAGDRNTPDENDQGTVVLGGNVRCASRFGYWAYPVPSGNPIIVLTNAPAQPYGQGYSTLNKVKS